MLPNFLLLGAMKAGTTSLFSALAQHPEIHGSNPKEPMYFSTRHRWVLGQGWYEARFLGHRGEKVLFEASTTYTKGRNTAAIAERIFQVLPETKLGYMVRCPVERMRSHHVHMVGVGTEATLSEVLEASDEYVVASSYYTQLRPYIERFPRENIKVLSFEEFCERPRELIVDLCTFLGVSSAPVETLRVDKKNTGKRALALREKTGGATVYEYAGCGTGLSAARRDEVVRRLQREQAQLEEFAGRKFEQWDIPGRFDALFDQPGRPG